MTARLWLPRGARSATRTIVLTMAAALMGVGSMIPARVVQARDSVQTQGQTVETSALPREAVETLDEIHAGGPFRYSKDGVVFNNFERQLPARPRGYYHEYTVWTPTAHNRGARRIVCGGPPRTPDDCYYTGDHYQTFQRILE